MKRAWLSIKPYLSLRSLIFGVVLSCLIIPIGVWAEYKPSPRRSTYSGSRTATGSRGECTSDTGTSLTALAPHQFTGQTVATHPTFVWYVPDQQPLSLEFQLYERNAIGNSLIYTAKLQSSPGLMQLSLPNDQPGLSIGRQYTWQVILFCDLNSPSSALVAGAELEVIALPSPLAARLASAQGVVARSDLYASASLWYDALAEITPLTGENYTDQRILLLQALASAEKAEERDPQVGQGKRLQQILDAGHLSQN